MRLTQFRCAVHNKEFAHEEPHDVAVLRYACPYCTQVKVDDLTARLSEAQAHRDLLLAAIDLKRVHARVKGGS